jgi:hypothetical protein
LDIHLPDDFPLEELVRVGSNPERSRTFDRGRAGSWQTDFSETHHHLLNSVAPTLLTDLGYASRGQPDPELGAASDRGGRALPKHAVQTHGENAAAAIDPVARRELVRIASLFNRLKSLDDHVPQRAALIEFAVVNLWLFAWTGDSIEKQQHRSGLNAHLTALRARSGEPQVTLPTGRFVPSAEMCRAALAKYSKVHFVDIGCGYGLETMLVAGLLKGYQSRFAITAFDCGLMGRLAPASFDLNGLAERIRFRNDAITCWDAVTPVFGEYGSLENMRIVNDNAARDTVAYPVQGVRLDTAFAELDPETKLVVKMHVQGGEFLALAGARKLLETGSIAAMIVAFAPHALSATDEPVNLLRYIPEGWGIGDLGPNSWTSETDPKPVLPSAFEQFVKGLSDSYTFLFLHSPDFDLAASPHFNALRSDTGTNFTS